MRWLSVLQASAPNSLVTIGPVGRARSVSLPVAAVVLVTCALIGADFASAQADPSSVQMAPIWSPGDGDPASSSGGAAPTLSTAQFSATDQAIFLQANEAADRKDWRTARSLAARGSDPVARRIIEWRYLLAEKSGARFEEISDFLTRHPNWPRVTTLTQLAEEAMPAEFDPNQVIGWYGTRVPITTAGRLRLGEALIAAGKSDEGAAAIRKLWIESTFSGAQESQILSRHGDRINDTDHRDRLSELLARNQVDDARRQIPRVDNQTQRLADARLRLKTAPQSASSIAATLDPSLRSDPWLIFDQARALRRNGSDEDAWAVMQLAPTQDNMIPSPERWWTERHIMARDALKVGQHELAYRLVSNHQLESGGGFADGEFLAGWIALRFLKQPDVAAAHFQTLAAGVSFPISQSRAYYWLGRAQEALGQNDAATTSYETAAAHASTFYGQLSLTRLHTTPTLHLESVMPDLDMARTTLSADERVQAMEILAKLKQTYLLRIFAMHLANEDRSTVRLGFLANFMTAQDDRSTALRIAKLASYQGVLMLPYLDPIIEMPATWRSKNVEPALVLGLTRQESEFDPEAVSTAGARGLMQLMPDTARQTAGKNGLTYRINSLVEPDYNMQLGIAHLSVLLDQWSGSYVLTIAAYNAGSGNVTRWVRDYGDPRDPDTDLIDWIELIPFGETRNYVQRVLENVQVYRNRLAGQDQQLMILADLTRSNRPTKAVPVPQPAPRG